MSDLRRRQIAPKASKEKRDNNRNLVEENSDQRTSCLAKCIKVLFYTVVVIAVISAVGYYRSPFTAISTVDFSKQVKLVGTLKVNKKLSEGTQKTGLNGPESIEEDKKGNLYTGLDDGRIIQIAPSSDGIAGSGDVTNITSGVMDGSPTSVKDATHGRPLGLRLRGDTLFVADAVYGLYSVNVKSKEVTSLVTPENVDPPLGFTDDLCLSKDGNFIYFSDGTSKYSYYTMGHFLLEGVCDGRLLQYNVHSKQVRVVMSGICFANGVQISDDEKVVFVSETFKYRVRVIDLMTWKMKSFVDVPIIPDNIRPSGKGTFWVAGGSPWSSSYGYIERFPTLRQILGGLFSASFITDHSEKHHNVLVEINKDGEILQTLQDPHGELTHALTQATTLRDGRLALGSFVGKCLAFSSIKHPAIGEQ